MESEDNFTGATNNERLLAAARLDNEEMMKEVFDSEDFDINYKDGLGNTALHYAASQGSVDVLDYLLSHEECDVDLVNRIEQDTPLHLAMNITPAELRKFIVESLLEAGADTTIRNKNGDTALDIVPSDSEDIKDLIYKARAHLSVAEYDIADDDEDDDEAEDSDMESDDD